LLPGLALFDNWAKCNSQKSLATSDWELIFGSDYIDSLAYEKN
jgi:hypothetical protein